MCPGNMETLILLNTVRRIIRQRAVTLAPRDITELFSDWANERALNISTGHFTRDDKWISDTLRRIAEDRRNREAKYNNNQGQDNTAPPPSPRKTDRGRGGRGIRGTGRGGRFISSPRGGRGRGGSVTHRDNYPPTGKLCADFNKGNCPRDEVDGTCTIGRLTLIHACNATNNAGLRCNSTDHNATTHQ